MSLYLSFLGSIYGPAGATIYEPLSDHVSYSKKLSLAKNIVTHKRNKECVGVQKMPIYGKILRIIDAIKFFFMWIFLAKEKKSCWLKRN